MNKIKIILLGLLLLTTLGCASHSEVRMAKDDAMRAAAEANSKAEQALVTALEAKKLAQDANDRSEHNQEMLNRGFKRSMYK